MPESYDVFLSHNSSEKPAVERIAVKLKRAGLEPWLDKWCLTPGASWQTGLAEGLAAAKSCAVLVGPHGLGDWAREELGVALDRSAKDRGFRLFLVLLPDLPEPFEASALPPFLSTRTWVDYRRGLGDERAFQLLVNAIHGVPPGPEVAVEARDDVCPYRGLRAFDEQHAEFFFGRDGDVQRLVEKLKAARFLAVMGPSGSGKSSVVRAGLIPALRRGALADSDTWEIRVLTPGAQPLTALTAQLLRLHPQPGMQETLDRLSDDERTLHLAVSLALAERPPGERVLWVVDQFEEVFTLCRDEDQRRRFFDNLLYATANPDGRNAAVLTLRADFYPRCAAYPELSARIAARQYLVSPMTEDGLRQAIEEPAFRAGLEIEEGLVGTILDDVARQPGALPLLQHALLELWQRRRGRLLTLEGYRASGGVEGAIAQRADTLYLELDADRQAIVRRALLRLTQPGEGSEDTRRRAPMSELATRPEERDAVAATVRVLTDARLLMVDADEETGERWVDVAHEALIRGWPRLREWIDEDRTGLRIHRRLTEAAQEWQRLERDPGLLFRGARLAEAEEWRGSSEGSLNDLEREFLDAGAAARDRQRRAARRRVQWALAGLTTALVLISAAAAVAFRQRDQARSHELAASATVQLREDPELGVLLALEATGIRPTAPAELALRRSLGAFAETRLRKVLRGHEETLTGVVFDPGGGRLLTASGDGTARLWDPSSGETVARLEHGAPIVDAGFDPSGERVVTAGTGGRARLWDAASGRQLAALEGHQGAILSAVFSADGTRLATAGADRTARVWDAAAGEPVVELKGHEDQVNHVAFDPSGRVVITAGKDGAVGVWDAATGELVDAMTPGQGAVLSAAFHPQTTLPVLIANLSSASLWPGPPGAVFVLQHGGLDRTGSIDLLKDHLLAQMMPFVLSAAYSPDGRLVATTGNDRTARIWEVPDPAKIQGTVRADASRILQGHDDKVTGAVFSPDSRRLVTFSADQTARLWDAGLGQLLAELRGHRGELTGASISPDGRWVATASADHTARIWDTSSGLTPLAGARWHRGASWLFLGSFSPDGERLVTLGDPSDGEPRHAALLWRVATGERLAELRGHLDAVQAAAFSPDGARVATASDDRSAWLWDAATGESQLQLTGHDGAVVSVAFSPDGRVLLTGGADRTARLWDAATGASLLQLRGHGDAVHSVAFSPDGRRVATASADGTARLWDAASGRDVAVLEGHTELIKSVRFSADGARVLTSSASGPRLWDAATGAEVAVLEGHTAAFGPGARVASASRDHTARIWDAATGQGLAVLQGHGDIVTSAEFSPDGKLLATSSLDDSVRLWDAGSGVSLIETRLPGDVVGVRFSPNGRQLLVASGLSELQLYSCEICGSLDELSALAEARVTRRLGPKEREKYLHQPSP